MAENTNTIWNLMISPESIHTASGQIDEIVSTIMNTYNAINEEIGVILQSWSGIAQDRHVKMFNEEKHGVGPTFIGPWSNKWGVFKSWMYSARGVTI